jgi:hypothetical protein
MRTESEALHASLFIRYIFHIYLELFERLTANLIESVVDAELGKVWSCIQCGKTSKNR